MQKKNAKNALQNSTAAADVQPIPTISMDLLWMPMTLDVTYRENVWNAPS